MFRSLCCLGGSGTATGGRRDGNENQKNNQNVNQEKTMFSSYKGEGLDMSSVKALTSSFVAKEGVDFVDLRAGEVCDICTSRPKTHFVVPCGHAACLPCWTTWLFDEANAGSTAMKLRGVATLARLRAQKPTFSPQQKCFVCQKPVTTIKRYAFSVVPQHPYETTEETDYVGSKRNLRDVNIKVTSVKEMETLLDASFERLMRSLLGVKDELRANIVSKLEEVFDHVENLRALGRDVGEDERSVILSVECVTVNEAFLAFQQLFEVNDTRHMSLWNKLLREVGSFKDTLKQLEVFLEEKEEQNPINSLPPPAVNQASTFETKQDTGIDSVDDLIGDEGDIEGDDDMDRLIEEQKAEQEREMEKASWEEISSTIELALSTPAIESQWGHVTKLLTRVSLDDSLIPTLLESFNGKSFEGNIDQEFILTVLSIASAAQAEVNDKFEELTSKILLNLQDKVNALL